MDLLLGEAGPVARPGRLVVASPSTMVSVSRTSVTIPVARVVYQRRWSSRLSPASGQPPSVNTFAVVAQQANGLAEGTKVLKGLIAPDHGRSREGVGVDAAGPGCGDQAPVGARAAAGGRIDDVMDLLRPHLPGPDLGARTGQATMADGHDLVHVIGSRRRSQRQCRWPIPRVAASRRPQRRPRC